MMNFGKVSIDLMLSAREQWQFRNCNPLLADRFPSAVLSIANTMHS